MAKQKKTASNEVPQSNGKSWLMWVTTIVSALSAITVLGFFLLTLVLVIAAGSEPVGNIAVIPIEGVIVTDGAAGFGEELTSSTKILKLLKQADEDEEIKAILLEINSPGGSAVASAEIADKLKTIQKPVYSVIRSSGASGAYWIASATDRIYAHRYAVTGSIGVIGSYLEFADLLKDYNITYRRMVAGKYKDAGSPWKTLSKEENTLIQSILDTIHEGFIKEVAKNRNLDEKKVRELATGFIYLGEEAVALGLVDEIGSKESAVKALEQKLNITAELAEFSAKKTFAEEIGLAFKEAMYSVGVGIGNAIKPESSTSLEISA